MEGRLEEQRLVKVFVTAAALSTVVLNEKIFNASCTCFASTDIIPEQGNRSSGCRRIISISNICKAAKFNTVCIDSSKTSTAITGYGN